LENTYQEFYLFHQSHFAIELKKVTQVKLMKPLKNISIPAQYYSGDQSFLPFVIPALKKGNFLILKQGDSLSFWANLSTKYDIKKVSKRGVKTVRILFGGVFPLLVGNKLQTGKDEFAGELRAVLFEVKPRSGTDEFVTVKLPRRSS
jgi:hypothetical protein